MPPKPSCLRLQHLLSQSQFSSVWTGMPRHLEPEKDDSEVRSLGIGLLGFKFGRNPDFSGPSLG